MKFINKALTYGFLLVLPAINGFAADSASHLVTVTVGPISEVSITGGDVALTLDQYKDGDTIASLPNSDTGLKWETNQEDRKITVATNVTEPACSLSVEAASLSGTSTGVSTGAVAIDTQAQDLVENINRGAGECTLVYTAVADLSSGDEAETHTVTYTITGN